MEDTIKNPISYGPTGGPTGSATDFSDFKIVNFLFGKYELTIKLSLNNEFLDILEIKFNKDFAASSKEAQPKGSHDVDKFYPEK